jgi:hypothetical protein
VTYRNTDALGRGVIQPTVQVVPLPRATTACKCGATDGMCHGWEGNTVYPTSWQPSVNDMAYTTNLQLVGVPVCPDLLRYEQIGEADNLRGRIVRGFFWLMRFWPA